MNECEGKNEKKITHLFWRKSQLTEKNERLLQIKYQILNERRPHALPHDEYLQLSCYVELCCFDENLIFVPKNRTTECLRWQVIFAYELLALSISFNPLRPTIQCNLIRYRIMLFFYNGEFFAALPRIFSIRDYFAFSFINADVNPIWINCQISYG